MKVYGADCIGVKQQYEILYRQLWTTTLTMRPVQTLFFCCDLNMQDLRVISSKRL